MKLLPPECQILSLKCTKFNFGWGAYSAPPDPLAVFKGPTSKGREGRKRKEGDGMEGKRGKGGREGEGEGRGGEGGEGVEGPGKWSAPGPVLALGGPGQKTRTVQ